MRTFGRTIILMLLVLLSGALANAQFLPDPVSLVASPSSPAPGSRFTIEAATPTFDRNSANFSWRVDGRARPDLSGPGRNTITLTAGGVGSAVRVEVDVSTPQGVGGNASLTVRVSDLVLTWFAETYTPRWYKGKALPIPESVVSVVAVPHIVLGGRTLAPRDLIYRWTLDDREEILSGIGEQVFRLKTSQFPRDSHHVRVVVEDQAGQIRQEKEIFIVSREPRLIIYNASPLGGVEPRSAPIFRTAGKDETRDFTAEPFYLPASSKKNLSFGWNVAGSDLPGNTGQEFTLTLNTKSLPLPIIPILVTVPLASPVLPALTGTITLFLP